MTIAGWAVFVVGCAIIALMVWLVCSMVECKPWIPSIIGGVMAAVLLICMLWWFNNTEAGLRLKKSQESNFGGGLHRIVTVYSYDGTPIKSWEGQFDVTENDQEVWFDIDGRRVIIQGGIIINEEVDENGR